MTRDEDLARLVVRYGSLNLYDALARLERAEAENERLWQFARRIGEAEEQRSWPLVEKAWIAMDRAALAGEKAPAEAPADDIVTAQHDETGHMWTGPRSQMPRRYFVVAPAEAPAECWCEACKPNNDLSSLRFIVCAICGNKRCPHATDHRNACTGSNEPGQKGSSWEDYPKSPAEAPAGERTCKCDLRTKLVGDGCEICNPGRYDDV